MGFGRIATRRLTQVRLELMPRRGGRWLARSVLLLAALAAGVGAGVLGRDPALALVQAGSMARTTAAPDELAAQIQPLRHEVDQTRLALRLSAARSQELERQVDALNQRLREATEELTFFRKAREGKR
jgi:septal ring factor EnvC (AmiA/AmiB activator)